MKTKLTTMIAVLVLLLAGLASQPGSAEARSRVYVASDPGWFVVSVGNYPPSTIYQRHPQGYAVRDWNYHRPPPEVWHRHKPHYYNRYWDDRFDHRRPHWDRDRRDHRHWDRRW